MHAVLAAPCPRHWVDSPIMSSELTCIRSPWVAAVR